MINKKKVIFICRHNSARSQLAEGLLKSLYGKRYEVFSAGSEPTEVSPYAKIVMSEIGLEITNLRSKSIDEFVGSEFDYIVTVCDSLQAFCPAFPGKGEQIHKSFEDPAAVEGSEDKKLYEFRKSRNEIKSWIIRTFGPNGSR